MSARRMRRAAHRRTVLDALPILGCSCRPNIRFTGSDRVRVGHDDWCPLIDGRPTIIVDRSQPQECER